MTQKKPALSLLQALVVVVDSWYSDWHRSAEEDELPPEYMQTIISFLVASSFSSDLNIQADLIRNYELPHA